MKGRNYRIPSGMPLTRKEFARSAPNTKIARFSTGTAGDYDNKLQLTAMGIMQIRHNAIEAARVSVNKKLAKIGEQAYFLQVRIYPHVILRENKMIATAGADRLQEGMRKAYGKPIGLAARVNRGTVILELSVNSANLQLAKEALRTATTKLPVETSINETVLRTVTQEIKT